MKPVHVSVPARILLNQELSGSAILLWCILRLCAHGAPRARLPALSGLSRPTVSSALAQLRAGGWLTPDGQPTSPADSQPLRAVYLPSDLLLAPELSVRAKLLYGYLRLTPRFHGSTGVTTIAQLSETTGHTLATIRYAIQELCEYAWLEIAQANKFEPIHFTLRNPVAALREQDVARAQERLDLLKHKGEALMREFLSLIIDSNEFEDNATPGFLINPYTGEEMQFDRYYPWAGVAFEFNGSQHYRKTAIHSSESKQRRQEGRDLMKIGICVRRGITLVVVHGEDLSLNRMREKVPTCLPLRELDGHQPLIDYLEMLGRGYRQKS